MIRRLIAQVRERFDVFKLRWINRIETWRFKTEVFFNRIHNAIFEAWIAVRYPPFLYLPFEKAAARFYEKTEKLGFDPSLYPDDSPTLQSFRYIVLCSPGIRLKGRTQERTGLVDVYHTDELKPVPGGSLYYLAGRLPPFYDVRVCWFDLARAIKRYRDALKAYRTRRIGVGE